MLKKKHFNDSIIINEKSNPTTYLHFVTIIYTVVGETVWAVLRMYFVSQKWRSVTF